jgi:hypothetical protein
VSSRKLVLALIGLLALVLVAGCGGGTSTSPASNGTTPAEGGSAGEESKSGEPGTASGNAGGPAPTKAAFIKEADEICGKADAKLTEEITEYAEKEEIPVSEGEEPNEEQQIEIFHAVVLPNIARQAEEIAALTPPKGDEGTIEDLTDTLSEEVAEAEETDSPPDGSSLEGATKKAHAYGLKTCGG